MNLDFHLEENFQTDKIYNFFFQIKFDVPNLIKGG